MRVVGVNGGCRYRGRTAHTEPTQSGHRETMEKSWRSHGEFMEKTWRSHGEVMEKTWRRHGVSAYGRKQGEKGKSGGKGGKNDGREQCGCIYQTLLSEDVCACVPCICHIRIRRLHPHMRRQSCPHDLGASTGGVLQPVFPPGGRVGPLFEVEVSSVSGEPPVPVDEGVVGVGGVVHVVGVLDELGWGYEGWGGGWVKRVRVERGGEGWGMRGGDGGGDNVRE